jgi:succinoglycan biosynthesis protein ExoM
VTSTVLIGIPSFRRPEGVRKLLQSLAKQKPATNLSVSLFVADNDPQFQEAKRTCDAMRSTFRLPLHCDVVEEPGVAAARNRILCEARRCGADYVAMLDDDQVAAPDWLSELLSMQHGTEADVVGGPVVYHFVIEPSASVRRWGYFNPRERRGGLIAPLTGAGNVLICCASLARLDWPSFDVQFGTSGGEDAEFFARVAARGFRFAWAPRAIAHEEVAPERALESALLNRAFRTGNNEVRIRRAHGDSGGIALMVGKAAALLLVSPVLVPLLLTPSRLWLLSKWASSAGRVSAMVGRTTSFYGDAESD